MKRDLRIDFLRGIVLLLIVLDHGRDNPVHKMFADGSKSITAIVTCWGYCDAAHAFIFLSGLVCGMVYWRLMLRQGAPAAVKKAFKRVGQLYAMHLTTLAVCAGIVFLAHASGKLDPVKVGMGPFVTEPVKAGVNALMLTYTPWLMDILKMYIILLLMLPVMLMVYRWRRWVAIGLSCAMYVFAQRCSDVVLPVYPQGQQWFWNPLAWQLLFFGGVWLGILRTEGRLRIPVRRDFFVVAVAVVFGMIWMRLSDVPLHWGWYNRMGLAPVPVISFTAFAYVVMCITVKFWPEHPNAFLGLFVQCGARSLPVFCVGVAATYLVAIAMQPLTRTAGEYVVLFAAMGSLLLVPKVLAMREGSKRVLPRSAEPIPARVPVAALSQAQAFEQNAPLQPVVTSAAKNVLESPKPVPVEI